MSERDNNPVGVKGRNNSSRTKTTVNPNNSSRRNDEARSSIHISNELHVAEKADNDDDDSHLDAGAKSFTPSVMGTTITTPDDVTSEIESMSQHESEECDKEQYQESFERASADLEILCAAYPEEIAIFGADVELAMGEDDAANSIPPWFPLVFTLTLPETIDDALSYSSSPKRFGGNVTMEFPKGYPSKKLQVVKYRTSPSIKKEFIEQVVTCVRASATEAVEIYGGEECGLACCAAAIECWNECLEREMEDNARVTSIQEPPQDAITNDDDDIQWITAENTLVDRKSVFQAHLCVVNSDDMVRRAVNKLIQGSNKIQRASHNMFAYRFVNRLPDGKEILKHDNDDDGEDAAGSRLAQLLEMRKEDGVLILVSRWFGGTQLGPKRFAHITNVARDLLVDCHEKGLLPNPSK